MSILANSTIKWLEDSNCFEEVAPDYVVVANAGIRILLGSRAIEDLNRQAREAENED